MNIEESINAITIDAPVVLAFDSTTKDIRDFKLIIKRSNIIRMPNLMTAVNCCISAYYMYIFNISYPRAIAPIMTLLESVVYKIKPSRKLPVSLLTTIDSIERTIDSIHYLYTSCRTDIC